MTISTTNRLIQIPQPLAIAFVSVTCLIMAYSHLVSVIPILIMYAMWLPFLYYKKEFALRPSKDTLLLLFFAGYCLLSTIWSDYPNISAYSGTQYLSMIICTIIIMRRVELDTFLKGLSLGIFFVLLIPLFSGPESYQYLFGSKNMVGFYSEIGVISAIFLLASAQSSLVQKLSFGILPLLVSGLCLAVSHSVSSVISTGTVLSICCAGFIIGKLPQSYRAIVLSLCLIGAASIAFCLYAFQIDIYGEILDFFGKDRTLTGRTDLWKDGIGFAMNNPILGNGYSAFWIQGRPAAEALWEEFYISTRSGFHFHNLFVQTWVDLGAIGLITMATMIFAFCYKSMKLIISEGSSVTSVFLLSISLMFLTRSFVEVDILNAFGMGSFLFYSNIPRVFEKRNMSQEEPISLSKQL